MSRTGHSRILKEHGSNDENWLRANLQAGTSEAASTAFLSSRLSAAMGDGHSGVGGMESEASAGSKVIDSLICG